MRYQGYGMPWERGGCMDQHRSAIQRSNVCYWHYDGGGGGGAASNFWKKCYVTLDYLLTLMISRRC